MTGVRNAGRDGFPTLSFDMLRRARYGFGKLGNGK